MTVHIEFLFTTRYKSRRQAEKGRKKCDFVIKQSKWPPPIRTIVSDVK